MLTRAVTPGAEGREQSLIALLDHWALANPGRPALDDPPNKPDLGLGPAISYDFSRLRDQTIRLARFFLDAGLKPGDTVALQLANTTELPVLVLALIRAGLVACPLPLLWRGKEIRTALRQIAPAALITIGRFRDHDHGLSLRDAASEQMSVRYIFGLGEDLADGITPISYLFTGDDVVSETRFQHDVGEIPAPAAPLSEPQVEQVALINWAAGADGRFYPLPRSQLDLLSAGLMHVLELGLGNGETLLNAFPFFSLTGISGMLVPWLVTGGRLLQHHPFDYKLFAHQIETHNVGYTAVPSSVFGALYKRFQGEFAHNRPARLGCVWPAPHLPPEPATRTKFAPAVYDIRNLSNTALLIERRNDSSPCTDIPLGRISYPRHNQKIALLKARLGGTPAVAANAGGTYVSGKLEISGAALPREPVLRSHATGAEAVSRLRQGFFDTGLTCMRESGRTDSAQCVRNGNVVHLGGMVVNIAELDELFRSFPGFVDAAAFTTHDRTLGEGVAAAAVARNNSRPGILEVKAWFLKNDVAPYKLPQNIYYLDALPKNAQGKIMRDRIARQIARPVR